MLELCRAADVVFVALHGAMGENGQLQAALDCFGIRYTGTGYAGSLLAMDKDIAKRLLHAAGIDTSTWVSFDGSALADTAAAVSQIEAEVGYPCVVKPTGCGSSVGVSIVRERTELGAALKAAAGYGSGVIAEKYISGARDSGRRAVGRGTAAHRNHPQAGLL